MLTVWRHAGLACRAAGKSGMALAFLNRFLDIAEAIDDGDSSAAGGVNDFKIYTGIPPSSPLPPAHYAPVQARDEVCAQTASSAQPELKGPAAVGGLLQPAAWL